MKNPPRTQEGVLIPESHSAKSLACVRSLGAKGVRTIVAVEEGRYSPAAASKYCEKTVTVPSPHENLLAYKNALLSFAARPDVRTIIPSREEDAFVLAKYRAEFEPHVEPLWPPFDTLSIAQDGLRLVKEVPPDVPVPETAMFDDVEDWNRELIVKARYPLLTDGYVDSLGPAECEGQAPPIHHRPGSEPNRDEILDHMNGHVPIVQEYVPIEHEYSFRALYDHGEAVQTSVRRQIRGMSYAGGVSVYRQLVENPEVEALGRRVLDHLGWHGLATVQFIESSDSGEYTLLEINPRTWSSIPCDVRAGADYPYSYWQLAVGDRERIDPTHEIGYATHLLYGELQYLASILGEEETNAERPTVREGVRDVATSILRDPNFDYLVRDDPKPFVHAMRNQLVGRG